MPIKIQRGEQMIRILAGISTLPETQSRHSNQLLLVTLNLSISMLITKDEQMSKNTLYVCTLNLYFTKKAFVRLFLNRRMR